MSELGRYDPPSGRAIRTRVSGLAHELKNALFGVAATLDAFDERYSSSLGDDRYVDVIREQIARVAVLMQGLIDLGDPSMLRAVPTSIREVVDAAVASCRDRAEAYDVGISITIEPGLPPVRLDRPELARALRDVTSEAVRVSPVGATVRISVRRSDEPDGHFAICDVIDEGPRWADVDEDDLREAFFTRRRGSEPHALATARRIVVGYGGTVEAGNRAERGGVVRLRIPL